jgi:hypothetical protein
MEEFLFGSSRQTKNPTPRQGRQGAAFPSQQMQNAFPSQQMQNAGKPFEMVAKPPIPLEST